VSDTNNGKTGNAGTRYGYVTYHTPTQRAAADSAVGTWRFRIDDDAVAFPDAWSVAVQEFTDDPDIKALCRRAGHGLNYGDLIEHGTAILARHGLHFEPDPRGDEVLVDHDDVLVDPKELDPEDLDAAGRLRLLVDAGDADPPAGGMPRPAWVWRP
jgi:hypothetical protein